MNYPPHVRRLPDTGERVESGAVAFGDDWPGVFIRGDSAAFYAQYLRAYLTEPLDPGGFYFLLCQQVLFGLLTSLESSDLTKTPRETLPREAFRGLLADDRPPDTPP